MDNKKDISTSFNQRESKNAIVLKLFEKDSHLLFVYKKSERIVTALYLVSNFLSDNDPIKWQFRNIGINFISQTLFLASNPPSKPETISKLIADLVKLISLLEVSHIAGQISEMNFGILKNELEHLLETLDFKGFSPAGQVSNKAVLDREFFSVPSNQLISKQFFTENFSPANNFPTSNQNGEGREAVMRTWSDVGKFMQEIDKRQNKGQKIIKDTVRLVPGMRVSDSSGVGANESSRQVLIVELLKSKSNLTIKDFVPFIKGCSGKTIQRELLRLVKLGVLKKEGERRWSRYSLAG